MNCHDLFIGKYKGQLAAACGVNGKKGLYPVAYGVFGLETTENWKWFVTQLRNAIGNPPGLALSSDASKGLASAIATTFSSSEHRECMRHLMENFKKKFRDDLFKDHMWPAAKVYTIKECEAHLNMIKEGSPAAFQFLERNHKQLWCRSKFSKLSKCEYIVNNISETFNSWIKDLKELHVIEVLNQIRQRIMVLFAKRRVAGTKLDGVILPSVMKQLHKKSRKIGQPCVNRGGETCAEVSGLDTTGKAWRYAVQLDTQECTCGEWQLCGKPCAHAIAFIGSLRETSLENYIHEYYSVDRYKAAYAGVITPISDKSQWEKVDVGFVLCPPNMKRPAGRPRKQRIPGCLEKTRKKINVRDVNNMGINKERAKNL